MISTRSSSIIKNARRLVIWTAATTVVWCCTLGVAAEPDTSADALASVASTPVAQVGAEKFVPNITPITCAGTLEMLRTAEIPGKQIRVRQVVRWSEADSASFGAIADLVIDRFDGDSNRKLTLAEVRSTLTGAGVNLGLVKFTGSRSCLLSHSPAPEVVPAADDHAVVQQWIEQKNKADAVAATSTQPSETAGSGIVGVEANPYHTLRERMLIDLSERVNIPQDQLQISFSPKDRALLNLTEPTCQFELQSRRVRDLGRVGWDVTITTGNKQQTVEINADARAWQKQLIMARSATYKQVLREDDLIERRVLIEQVSPDPVLTRSQVVGQQASRDLKPGTVLTGRLIDPLPLVKQGQYVTVTLCNGGVQVRTVAVAMESGSFGQTIKVQSEQTKDVFDVTLTGPQAASMGTTPPTLDLAGDRQTADASR